MAQSNGDRLCWDWNPGRPDDVGDPAPALDLTQTLSHLSADRETGDPPAIRALVGDLAAPLAAFTLHNNHHDPITIDPDATIGVFAGTNPAAPGSGNEPLALPPNGEGVPFPQSGDGIAGFRLLSELGRGAFGRVFLAEESLLGNRLVALKITRAEGDEPRILARLQHTHIVPIHSVHDDPKTGLRVMCMPYFGGANLAQVLEAASAACRSQGDQRSLLQALDVVAMPPPSEALGPKTARRRSSVPSSNPERAGEPLANTLVDPRASSSERARPTEAGQDDSSDPRSGLPASDPARSSRRSLLGQIPWWTRSLGVGRSWSGIKPTITSDRDPVQPARRFLREANFVRAAAWIIARLADGLEHAHSHGLMHRDLKPSNILIAADGTPMLLDFNLAADMTVKADEVDRVRMGGTLPYMSPEHLDAFHPQGTTPPGGVDERSDIYALGLILFEMIAGNRPFAEPEPNRPILTTIRTMIDERRAGAPAIRSIDPSVPIDLAAVIRKCLDPDPERRHARAGDLAEDIRRFLDDQPLKYTSEPSLRGRLAKWARRNPRATGASTVGMVGLAVVLSLTLVAWSVTHHMTHISARLKLNGFEARFPECQFLLNTVGGPLESLGRGISLAEETLSQAGVTLDPQQDKISDGWLEILPTDEQKEARDDLAELILLVARARIYLADRTHSKVGQRQAVVKAVAWLDRAEMIDPTPTVSLLDDRASYLDRLGQTQRAAEDRALSSQLEPTSGRDFHLLGTALLARGQTDRAEIALNKAIALTPQRFWPWFALGLCHFDQKRFTESAGDFAVCTVLSPRFAWPWMNRGLSLARAGRLTEARAAYDRALELDDSIADALTNRGLVALELNDLPAAVSDLQRAFDLGGRGVGLQAALAQALGQVGRTTEAMKMLDSLISQYPDAPLPRVARGTLQLTTNPTAAEADFRAILARDARHPRALYGLAWLHRLSQPRRALEEAVAVLQADPNQIDALELSAWLRAKLGDPATIADVERLVRFPTPRRLYDAACSLAIYGEQHPGLNLTHQAIAYLQRAAQSGNAEITARIRDDPDLASLRDHPDFQKLLATLAAATRAEQR